MSSDPGTTPSATPSPGALGSTVPERLLDFLDRLGGVLADRGDAVALLGLGSVGRDLHRLDEHSDADFFVVVDDEPARRRYLADIEWLEAAQPVAWSFENGPHGRKALLDEDLFAEYAVFSLKDMATAGYPPGRIVWQRADAPDGLEEPTAPLPELPGLAHQVGEAVTNLYVGLHRDLRGERLSATRFIQGYAVDRLTTVLGLLGIGSARQQDVFAVERGVERRFTAEQLPVADLVPGYEHNGDAALALLGVLERHVEVPTVLAREIRSLAARSQDAARSRGEQAAAGQWPEAASGPAGASSST